MINAFKNLDCELLLNALADAALLVDHEGTVILANDSAHQMLAYPADKVVGLKVEALIPQSFNKHHAHLREQYFKKPEKRSMGKGKNLVTLSKGGVELPVDIGLNPIEIDAQHFVLVTMHTADKQVVAEASLKSSEERLRLAQLSANLGIFDINLAVNQVQLDQFSSQLFGFPVDQLLAYTSFIEAIHIADQVHWQSMLDQAIKSQAGSNCQLEFRIKDALTQEYRCLHVSGNIFFKGDVAVRILGVAQDITEKKQLLHRLNKQRIDLEVLSKTQIAIQTASAIAHEINQPLAAISAYSEVALYALKAETVDTDRLNRSLSGCVTQAQRAGNTLHELMEFLQKGEIESAPLDLNEAICEALDITKHNDYGGFHSTIDLEPDLPKVLANETQLQKVFVNLLRNGVEAVHSTGVPIAEIEVKVCTYRDIDMAEVIIQDNGPGITQEVTELMFEPFFTTKAHGIGMGLAISRTLVEASGGSLWFDTESQHGATFHLTLPFAKE